MRNVPDIFYDSNVGGDEGGTWAGAHHDCREALQEWEKSLEGDLVVSDDIDLGRGNDLRHESNDTANDTVSVAMR